MNDGTRCPQCNSDSRAYQNITAIPIPGVFENGPCGHPWHNIKSAIVTEAEGQKLLLRAMMSRRAHVFRDQTELSVCTTPGSEFHITFPLQLDADGLPILSEEIIAALNEALA